MSAKHVDLVEKKRKEASIKLKELFEKGEIEIENYQELTFQNERLAQILSSIFVNGEKLVKDGVVASLSEILEFRRKPHTNEEAFEIMRKMVIEGSENPRIRKFSVQLAEKSSRDRGIPVPIPPVDRLYSNLPISADEESNVIAFVEHCNAIVYDIFKFVSSHTVYVSDPPDDYFQTPLATLETMDLKGDCDDLAILLCSIFRSIGFRTFLGYQPSHVFAGVVLAQVPDFTTNQVVESERDGIFRYIEVPLDPQLQDLDMTVSFFDAVNGNFVSNLRQQLTKENMVSAEKVENALGSVQEIEARLSKIDEAKIFFIDTPNLQTIKLSNLIQSLISG